MQGDNPPGRFEEREQRHNAEQQQGDTFAVDTDEPTDTSGVPTEEDEETGEDTPGGPSSAWIDYSRYAVS